MKSESGFSFAMASQPLKYSPIPELFAGARGDLISSQSDKPRNY